MQYYALVNTATPQTGLITVGEMLTKRQAAALGKEKIEELVREHVLSPCEAPKEPERDPGEAPETPSEETEEAVEEEQDDEMPELDVDGLVQDHDEEDKPPDAKPRKGRGKQE